MAWLGRQPRTKIWLLTATMLMVSSSLPLSGHAATRPEKPDIVLIVTDDQTWNTLQALPFVRERLIGRGVKFTNAFVVNSLCCPSRASMLTGQYSHSTHVYTGADPGTAPSCTTSRRTRSSCAIAGRLPHMPPSSER